MRAWPSLILIALTAALSAAADVAEHPQPMRVVGKVKSVEADALVVEVPGAHGGLTVELDAKTRVSRCKTSALKGLAAGAEVHLLCREHAASRRQKAFVDGVAAIVVEEKFSAPAIPADLSEERLKWVTGKLTFDHGRPQLGFSELHVATDRLACLLGPASKEAIAAGDLLFVEAEKPEKGARAVKARRAVLLAPDAPQADLHAILGL